MNRFLIACLACLVLLPIAVATQSCSYVGVGGGSATWDLGETSGFDQVDDSDTLIKVFGGFDLGETFAIELAYADLGEASVSAPIPGFETTLTWEATAISAALAGQLPLGETFALFGKAGMAYWDAEFTLETTFFGFPLPPVSDSGTGVDPLFGFGLAIMPGETFGFRLEFERYLSVAEDIDVDVASASVLFRF